MSRIVILLLCALCAFAQGPTETVPPPSSDLPISHRINPPNPSTHTTDPPTSTKPTTASTPIPTTPVTTTPIPTTPATKPTPTTSTSAPTTPSTKPTTPSPKPTTPSPKPTTPSPKPTTPTPTPKPKPVEPAINSFTGNYSDSNNNNICLMMTVAVQIELLDNATTKITVTDKVNSSAVCVANTSETLNIFWDNDTITFTFLKNNSNYEIQSVIANISVPGGNRTILYHTKPQFSVSATQSYKCAKDQPLNLTTVESNVTFAKLHISHLQYQAFMNTTKSQYDSAWYCDATNTPDIVPVIVGCVLAVLVVLVLVAYLFGRKRWQARGYLSMFAEDKNESDYIPMKTLSCFK